MELAVRTGGRGHHLKAIQLPYNLGMPEAFVNQNQTWKNEAVSAIEFARRAGLLVFASASLLQGRLTVRLTDPVRRFFADCPTPAICALQFVRSTPGVTTALAGMKLPAHVSENLKVAAISPLGVEAFMGLFNVDS